VPLKISNESRFFFFRYGGIEHRPTRSKRSIAIIRRRQKAIDFSHETLQALWSVSSGRVRAPYDCMLHNIGYGVFSLAKVQNGDKRTLALECCKSGRIAKGRIAKRVVLWEQLWTN